MPTNPLWRAVRLALIALVSGGLASTILAVLALRFYLGVTRPYETSAFLALSFVACFWLARRRQWPAERFKGFAAAVMLVAAFSAGFWGQFHLLMAIWSLI